MVDLQKYYPKVYYGVRVYFERNGFEHIQGSGDHPLIAMSEAKAMAVIYQMTKEFS